MENKTVFSSREQIRDWMLKNKSILITKVMGFINEADFLKNSGNRSYEEFVEDYYGEGMCWEEFVSCSEDVLHESIKNYGYYWF